MLTGDAQRSTGVMVRPYRVAAHSINVDAIQEPVQLFARQLDYGLLPSWPYEVVFFEAPQHHPETVAIVEQQFDPVAFAVVEGEHGPCKRIELHGLLDKRHETIDAGPEVDRFAMQEDRQVRFEAEHQRAPNAATIALTIATSSVEHSSSSFTPLGRWADSRASRVERGEMQDDSALVVRCDAGADAMTAVGSSIATTGTNADGATGSLYPIGGRARSRA
jgi:hypothetical protein